MADAMRTLPDAELEVMQAIWACEEPVKRAAISAILDRTHPMAPTTLLTVLSRLADKGFVRIEKTGRSAEYRPLVAKEDYLARQGRKFYDKLCGGSVSAFAAALSASGLTAEELAQLRELLRGQSLEGVVFLWLFLRGVDLPLKHPLHIGEQLLPVREIRLHLQVGPLALALGLLDKTPELLRRLFLRHLYHLPFAARIALCGLFGVKRPYRCRAILKGG